MTDTTFNNEEVRSSTPQADLDFVNAVKVGLNGERYALYFTSHSYERARERLGADIFCEVIPFTIKLINDRRPDLLEIERPEADESQSLRDGYISFRSYPAGLFFVIHVNKETKRVRVVTVSGLDIYPRVGDYVISYKDDGSIKGFVWKHK